ncbi:MAG: hypothetical protein IJS88_05075 [Alphaproteobacteria bacterium]|nr:hypothetical protein [Alphaproteobacteria bacterium]
MDMVIIIIFTAIAVYLVSWAEFILFRKRINDALEVCARIAAAWCSFDFVLLLLFFGLYFANVNIFGYPLIVFAMSCLFVETFLCGAFMLARYLMCDPRIRKKQITRA